MKNRYFRVLISAFLLSSVCYSQVDIPGWIESRPIDPDYYIGIGHVSIRDRYESEYQKEANELAFIQISNQIRTEVSGQSESIFYEDDQLLEEKFTEVSKTSTVADLEGLEFVDSYWTKYDYFVYWRLLKGLHRKNIEKYEVQAISAYDEANQLTSSAVVVRLSLLIKAYESILRAHGKIITIQQKGRDIVLNTNVPRQIEEIFSSIEMYGMNTYQNARPGQPLDAPLRLSASWRSTSEKIEIPLSGLTIRFSVIEGEVLLDTLTRTGVSGECRSFVSEVVSDMNHQAVLAKIDLKTFKLSEARHLELDSFLDKLTASKTVKYSITVGELASERIAIKVFGEQGISPPEIRYINEVIISSFKNVTEFEVMERGMMEEILREQGFNAAECSSEECQVEVGRMLAVRKMMYLLLWKIGKEYRGTMKFVNIETGENEHVESVKYHGTVAQLADLGIQKWVKDFYNSLNRGRLTLTSSIQNVQIFYKDDFWGELPIWDKKLESGIYHLTFIRPGYETKKLRYKVTLGKRIEEQIRLKPKSRGKAFMKSLIFPGFGQSYSSDQNNIGRRTIGFIFKSTAVVGLAGSAYAWSSFIQAKNDYDHSYKDYMKQETTDAIIASRLIAQEKNQMMVNSQSTAVIVSGIIGVVWIVSALEAAINFPNYGSGLTLRDDPVRLSFVNPDGRVGLRLTYRISL